MVDESMREGGQEGNTNSLKYDLGWKRPRTVEEIVYLSMREGFGPSPFTLKKALITGRVKSSAKKYTNNKTKRLEYTVYRR